MTIDKETILSMDQRWARLGIDAVRAAVLAGEVGQLAEAIEKLRARVRFDDEPAGFTGAANGEKEPGQ